MFYGAYSKDIAIAETYKTASEPKKATIAEFISSRDLLVIDLSEELAIPSIFDAENRHNREQIKFINSFIFDISQPIDREEKIHIDYVPTQVVCEYLRYEFKVEKSFLELNSQDQEVISSVIDLSELSSEELMLPIDGIIYSSAQRRDGKAIVLFANNSDCGEIDSSALLKLVGKSERAIPKNTELSKSEAISAFDSLKKRLNC